MSADARPGPQHVHTRVVVRQPDRLPDVDADAFGDQRELVGQRHVHVAVGVFHDFDHLGGRRVSAHDRALDERAVQLRGCLGAGRREATRQAVVLLELDEDSAGQHALGTVREVEVHTRSQTRLGKDRRQYVTRRAGRDGRLQHHQVATAQERGDVARGAFDVAQVGRVARRVERRRHGDDERVGRLWPCPDPQPARVDGGGHQRLELGLVKGGQARVQRRLDARARIDADDVVARQREHAAGRQADVPEAEDADGRHSVSSVPE